MSFCQVTYSANAGVALRVGDTRILVDAFPDQRVTGFSCLSPDLWNVLQKAPAFQNPDIICYTHCHPDHFSYEKTQFMSQLWPNAKLILPEKRFQSQVVLDGDAMEYTFRDLHFHFIKLPHAGEEYSDVRHYGMIISYEGKHIFLAGDGEVACREVQAAIAGIHIDVALLNFPWMTLQRGRTFLAEYMRPRHLLVYHLPFATDDIYGFRKAVDYSVKSLFFMTDLRILRNPLQTETFLLP